MALKKSGSAAKTSTKPPASARGAKTSDQDRIDLNDPRRPGHEVVAEQLGRKADKA